MLYAITHRTRLGYSHPISESVMEVRVSPRTDTRQVLRQFDIVVTPAAKANQHVDWLGNTVHHFSVLGIHEHVDIVSRCVVETRPVMPALTELVAPLDGLMRDHRSWDFLQHHGPVLDDPALPALTRQLGLDKARSVGEAIEAVMQRARDVISYRRGATNSSSTVSDVLKAGAGVCQDFAHLSLALLRRIGLPCRYVSGYLKDDDAPETETHAWIEAFVPRVGWVAFDPTHGVFVNERYITVAAGRSYADVPPNRGVFIGEATEAIQVSVAMERQEEHARLTPYSTTNVDQPRKASFARQAAGVTRAAAALEQQLSRPSTAGAVMQQQRQQQQTP